MRANPCYNGGEKCPMREAECHSRCDAYRDWRRERDVMLAAAYHERQTEAVEIEHHIRNKRAYLRRRR